MKPVFITGYGITSAIGTGTEVLMNLEQGNSGISPIAGINGLHKPFLGGQIKRSNQELLEDHDLKGLSLGSSRSTILAAVAIKDLLSRTAFTPTERSAFLNGASVGGMDTTEIEYLGDKERRNAEQFLHHPIGQVADNICRLNNWPIYRTTISTACSSAANSIMLAGRSIRSGRSDRVIAGGCDPISLFTLRGFDSLMIYDDELCKPFDQNRKGLNLGEAAAYLMLESEVSIKETGNKPIAVLAGWANANDAYHQTASSPNGRGAYESMNKALECAGMVPEDIDYINAHGTATPNNDLSEAIAIDRTFSKVPPFSSTKSLTGHTLAAAGAIEAVFSILALEQKTIWGNKNHDEAMETPGIIPQLSDQKVEEMRAVLSNSFGFGGNNSSLIISSC